jgi:orotidine-5'-phosphate decarboxylase
MTIKQNKERICLALDVDSLDEGLKLVKLLKDYVGIFKIGVHLFTKEGPKAVEKIIKIGGKVFLDLKYHDIPNTVANAARMATKMGVYMFDVHSSGGSEMMKATVDAVNEESEKNNLPKPIILAITVLTSLNDEILNNELKISNNVQKQVIQLAKLAKSSNIDGVVASPKEITVIRKACGKDFTILTPGIRPAGSGEDDQKRITTPSDAIKLGADFIVIGRPILKAKDPVEASNKILSEIDKLNV